MQETFRQLQIIRALIFWLALFIVVYGLTLLLYSFYLIQPSIAVMIAMQVHTPLAFFFFSWLHFRGVRRNDWSIRIIVSLLWVCLTVLASTVLVGPVYGLDWTYVISPYVVQGQLFNIVAIFVGAYLAKRPHAKIIEIPKSVEKKLEKRGY